MGQWRRRKEAILPYVLGDDLAGAVRQVEVEKISEQRHGGDELRESSTEEGRASRSVTQLQWQPLSWRRRARAQGRGGVIYAAARGSWIFPYK